MHVAPFLCMWFLVHVHRCVSSAPQCWAQLGAQGRRVRRITLAMFTVKAPILPARRSRAMNLHHRLIFYIFSSRAVGITIPLHHCLQALCAPAMILAGCQSFAHFLS